MKLDRNVSADGRGKYGLIKNRRLAQIAAWDGGDGEVADRQAVLDAVALLERAGVIDWGVTPETEFFAMRVKDEYARDALIAYACAAAVDGEIEYAGEIFNLAKHAGCRSQHRKTPD